MSRSVWEEARELELENVRKAEWWYESAVTQTQKLLEEYDLLPAFESDLGLVKALKFQREMMDEYADLFRRFMPEDEAEEQDTSIRRPRVPRFRSKKLLVRTAGGV